MTKADLPKPHGVPLSVSRTAIARFLSEANSYGSPQA